MADLKTHIAGWNAQTEFAAEFEHNGSRWGVNFFAVDAADAECKVDSMRKSLKLIGEVVGRVPWDKEKAQH